MMDGEVTPARFRHGRRGGGSGGGAEPEARDSGPWNGSRVTDACWLVRAGVSGLCTELSFASLFRSHSKRGFRDFRSVLTRSFPVLNSAKKRSIWPASLPLCETRADGIAGAQVCRHVHSNTADARAAGFGVAATCQEVVLKQGQATLKTGWTDRRV